MRSLAEGEEGQKPGFGYDGKFGTEMGYQGLTTVEQVMERYPIDEFEADRDIKEGRVRSFPSVEAAIEYLRTQINS
ncbi:MAG: hypothetical protein EPN86_06220 [Nanoarchaeota archaeon]|nr:MAG: hypothetical protein EPN86_06220 [Nanoarchaeota archaeon]